MAPPILQPLVNRCRLRSLLRHADLPFFVAVSAFALSGASLYYPLALVCTKSPVSNVTDPSVLERRDFPGFVRQSPDAPELRLMKTKLAGAVPADASGMGRATAIRKWCRDQQIGSWGGMDNSSENPLLLLERQRQGMPGSCRRFAYVLAGALTAEGLDARVVGTSAGLYDRIEAAHTLVEVWIPEFGHWVLIDSMFNVTYLVDGRPASLLDVYDAANTDGIGRISFDRDGSETQPSPPMGLEARMFKHLLYSTTNAYFDGYHVGLFGRKRVSFAHYAGYGNGRYPGDVKNILLWVSICFFGLGVFRVLLVP